jgi:glutathione S-transferase
MSDSEGLTLFHAPGSCSVGIRVLLEEIGAPYRLVTLDLRAGSQCDPEFLATNAKGKVPALRREDGSVLTEFPAIALWLARRLPKTDLWPADLEGEVRTLELIDFLVSSVHMRGFTLALVPMKFAPEEAAQQAVRAHGRIVAEQGLALAVERLGDMPFFHGARPGAADAALIYMLPWAARVGIELPAPLVEFHDRMLARPAVRRAFDLPAS